MNREQFFQELRTALHREGFTPQPEQDELLASCGVGWSPSLPDHSGRRRSLLAGGCSDAGTGTGL